MKKLIFVLAILIAVPAFAALDVSLVDNGDGTVSVMYTGADGNSPSTMPRAFALDITIDVPGSIDDVSGYKNDWVHDANGMDETEESNSVYPGFGVYPARIAWVMNDISNYGTPLADEINDPGAGDGIYSSHIVLEMASLYYGDVNRPPSAGKLCDLHISCNGGENLNLSMVDEDTYRGGLVYEDGSLGEVDANIIVCPGAECNQPVPPTTPTPSNGAIGVVAKLLPTPTYPTLSWTPGAGGDNPRYDVYFDTVTPPVTVVSPNQTGLSHVATTAVQGKTYYWQIVAKNDCNSTGVSGPIWSFNTDCYKSTAPDYAVWVQFGKPDCWCYQRHCRGDYNGTKVAVQWVQANDLNALVASYGKNLTWLTQNPQYLCADFNHAKVAVQRVQANDLNILVSYYGKNSTVVTPCTENSGNMNFWTN